MKTTTQLLQEILSAKSDIKLALISKGLSVSDKLSTYAELIRNLVTEDLDTNQLDILKCAPLPSEQLVIGGCTIYKYNSNIKIYAEDKNSYSVLEWYNLTNKETLTPIGFEILANGEHFIVYITNKYRDVTYSLTSNLKIYYNIMGKTSGGKSSNGSLRAGLYGYTFINLNYNKVDLNNTTATCTLSDGKLTYATTNSPFTWEVNEVKNYENYKGLRQSDLCKAFRSLVVHNNTDRFNFYIANMEWLRHRAAIDSELATTEPDGTMGTVTIVTESDGEMYFYINGEKTNKLAKYNLHDFTTYSTYKSLSLDIADAIYEALKANGTNMNMSCEQSATDAPIPILLEGQKGAEAFAFNGTWKIITPIISNCAGDGTNGIKFDYNIPDLPYIQYILFLREHYNDEDILLPTERQLLTYFINSDILASIIDFLKHTAGGKHAGALVPNTVDASLLSSSRVSATHNISVSGGTGYITSSAAKDSLFVIGIKECE